MDFHRVVVLRILKYLKTLEDKYLYQGFKPVVYQHYEYDAPIGTFEGATDTGLVTLSSRLPKGMVNVLIVFLRYVYDNKYTLSNIEFEGISHPDSISSDVEYEVNSVNSTSDDIVKLWLVKLVDLYDDENNPIIIPHQFTINDIIKLAREPHNETSHLNTDREESNTDGIYDVHRYHNKIMEHLSKISPPKVSSPAHPMTANYPY